VIEVRTLVERCRRGDALAWEALVRRFQGRIYALACQYVGDRELARDVAQDVFVRVWQRLDTFGGGDAFAGWLIAIARNVCIDATRRRKARPPAGDVVVGQDMELTESGPDPEVASVARSRERLLYRALDRLTGINREMIVLKEIHGMKLEEISELLALPIGTVKSRSNRARIELAHALRAIDPGFGGGVA